MLCVLVVLDRELRLDDLLLERVLVAAEVEVAHELHRDRRAALQRLSVREVLDRRAEDAGQVDAVVLVEALVLDRDGRVLQVRRDLAPRDRRAQLVGLDEAEPRPVGGVHLRGAAADDRAQRADRRCRLRDVEHVADGRDRADDQRGDDHAAADQQKPRRAGAMMPAPALSSLSRHLRTFEIICPIVISCRYAAVSALAPPPEKPTVPRP